jgi:hypothetical protein
MANLPKQMSLVNAFDPKTNKSKMRNWFSDHQFIFASIVLFDSGRFCPMRFYMQIKRDKQAIASN